MAKDIIHAARKLLAMLDDGRSFDRRPAINAARIRDALEQLKSDAAWEGCTDDDIVSVVNLAAYVARDRCERIRMMVWRHEALAMTLARELARFARQDIGVRVRRRRRALIDSHPSPGRGTSPSQ
jgi:hypothetical protein